MAVDDEDDEDVGAMAEADASGLGGTLSESSRTFKIVSPSNSPTSTPRSVHALRVVTRRRRRVWHRLAHPTYPLEDLRRRLGRSRARPAACRPRRWSPASSRETRARLARHRRHLRVHRAEFARLDLGTEPRPRRRLSAVVDATPPPLRLPPAPRHPTHRAEHRHDRHEPTGRRDPRPSHPSPRPGGGRRHKTLIHVVT